MPTVVRIPNFRDFSCPFANSCPFFRVSFRVREKSSFYAFFLYQNVNKFILFMFNVRTELPCCWCLGLRMALRCLDQEGKIIIYFYLYLNNFPSAKIGCNKKSWQQKYLFGTTSSCAKKNANLLFFSAYHKMSFTKKKKNARHHSAKIIKFICFMQFSFLWAALHYYWMLQDNREFCSVSDEFFWNGHHFYVV